MKALIERLKRPSLALKLCAAFLALVFGVVLIINIYPVALARDLVSANKRSSMLDQASLLSTSLGALETLTENGERVVTHILACLEGLDRFIAAYPPEKLQCILTGFEETEIFLQTLQAMNETCHQGKEQGTHA